MDNIITINAQRKTIYDFGKNKNLSVIIEQLGKRIFNSFFDKSLVVLIIISILSLSGFEIKYHGVI